MARASKTIEDLQNSLRANKGCLTTAINATTNALKIAEGLATPGTVQSVIDNRAKCIKYFDRIEDLLIRLMEEDPDDFKKYESALNEAGEKMDRINEATLPFIEGFHQQLAERQRLPQQQSQERQHRPMVIRPVDSLRPAVLSKEVLPEELRVWMSKFRSYFNASHMADGSFEEQHAYFFACLDDYLAIRLRDRIRADTPVLGALNSCMSFLEEEFARRFPIFLRRVDFFQFEQASGQAFSDWASKLRKKAAEADLRNLGEEDLIALRYICGTSDKALREKFLNEANPTLGDLDRIAAAHEQTQSTMASLGASLHALQLGRGREKKKHKDKSSTPKGRCFRCGFKTTGPKGHFAQDCPMKNATCNGCGQKGHTKPACEWQRDNKSRANSKARSRHNSPHRKGKAKAHNVSEPEESDQPSNLNTVFAATSPTKIMEATPRFQLKILCKDGPDIVKSCLPDSGAYRTVFPLDFIRKARLPFNPQGAIPLFAANGSRIPCEGALRLLCEYDGLRAEISALVSSAVTQPLIGWRDLQHLGILSPTFPSRIHKVNSLSATSLISQFEDVFSSEVRPMNGGEMQIHLQDVDLKPTRCLTARQIPLHHREEADAVISKALRDGILQRVEEPSTWISPAFFVPKDGGKGGLRLVTDYTGLNKFTMRPVHPFPSSRDILNSISSDSKFFAKLDAVQGYFQIPLAEESSKLTTFLLPTGRYRYLRAPMGLNASSDEFCRRTDEALEGLPGVLKLVDDILIHASSAEQLHERISSVLHRCREHRITLSRKKFLIGDEVKFAGFIVSSSGIRPDPEKTTAIRDFPTPTDITSLRSFLGLANQLGHFVPDLAHASSVLRQLLKKDVAFNWLEVHQEAFEQVKKILTSELIVGFFDPSLPTELLTDASRLHGLGYALMQRLPNGNSRLIQCGSRSLNSAEANYATIELECLAIQWAIHHCRYFLTGANFSVLTDHRPLLGLFNKNLGDVENRRLQRIREKIVDFTFELKWVAGKTHQIADALSRSPIFEAPETPDEAHGAFCHAVASDAPLQEIYDAAEADEDYQSVLTALVAGKTPASLPPRHPAKLFSNVWGALSVHDDILLMYGSSRMVIPRAMRTRILALLHKPHAGITKTRQAAQRLYFWPGMTVDIKRVVESCPKCQSLRPSLPLEPLQDFPQASGPMTDVAVDLFQYGSDHFLVMVDRFSGFPMVHKLSSLSTTAITRVLQGWFNIFGRPERILSDNGPQFRAEFGVFCATIGCQHVTSSPYNPRSNGLAEAGVKIVKNLLEKVEGKFDALQEALSEWRTFPRSHDSLSPAELFLQRRPQGQLPHFLPSRRQQPLDGRSLPQLHVGQEVLVQDRHSLRWNSKGKVIAVRETGRSYVIDIDSKQVIRNRRFLRPCPDSAGEVERKPEVSAEPADSTPRRSERLKNKSVRLSF